MEGVVTVGSVATGQARESSDIDAIIFMHPVDRYILPTESIWCPWDDTFHGIFVSDQHIRNNGIHLDLSFRDTVEWSNGRVNRSNGLNTIVPDWQKVGSLSTEMAK